MVDNGESHVPNDFFQFYDMCTCKYATCFILPQTFIFAVSPLRSQKLFMPSKPVKESEVNVPSETYVAVET